MCFWGCLNCYRSVGNEWRFYEEGGIEYGEAICLRCGATARFPISEIPYANGGRTMIFDD
jgi:RNase P subunit RPR2